MIWKRTAKSYFFTRPKEENESALPIVKEKMLRDLEAISDGYIEMIRARVEDFLFLINVLSSRKNPILKNDVSDCISAGRSIYPKYVIREFLNERNQNIQ